VDYAVKMREFAQQDLASRMLERGELLPMHIDALAAKVAAFHAAIAGAAPPAGCGTPATILSVALANIEHLRQCMAAAAERAGLDRLEAWTRKQHALLAPMFDARRAEGFVRECHGDLHLGNIAVIAGVPVIFDCIEFNEAMRWIDVMSEIAFTVMDLQERGRADLACRFLNAWLERTGDYAGVPVLRFYLVYRALVRAKIAQLRAGQLADGADPAPLARERNTYLQLAQAYAQPPEAAVIVTHGVSGCGKTVLSGVLMEQIGAVRIRTDVERKRHFGVPMLRHDAAANDGRLYSAEASRRTYDRVCRLAAAVAGAGYVTIVDGAFLQRAQRDALRDLAARLRLPFVILAFTATEATLRRRLTLRSRHGNDASDADVAVLEQQLRMREVLAADEAADTVAIDTEGPLERLRSSAAWHAVRGRIGRACLAAPPGAAPPGG
jgi:aminoglycoside phosphotransferase family enzyme/predicted kinase